MKSNSNRIVLYLFVVLLIITSNIVASRIYLEVSYTYSGYRLFRFFLYLATSLISILILLRFAHTRFENPKFLIFSSLLCFIISIAILQVKDLAYNMGMHTYLFVFLACEDFFTICKSVKKIINR